MKMLKHLFGKRDKELDVLQEEALQSPLRTVVRNFTSNRLAFGGLIVFLVIFLIVLIGPVFNKNCSSLLFFKKHGIGRSGACNIAGTNSFVGRSKLRTVVRRSLVRSAAYSLIASSSLSFVISIVIFSSIISQYPFLQKPAQNLRTSHYITPPAKNECFF